MRQQQLLTLVLGLLLIGFVSNAPAATLSVTIQGITPALTAQTDATGVATVTLAPACDPSNCPGTSYGAITVKPIDTTQPATVVATDWSDGTNDEMKITNAQFVRNQDPGSTPLTIVLSVVDFTSPPDGTKLMGTAGNNVSFFHNGSPSTAAGCTYTATSSVTVNSVATGLSTYTYTCRLGLRATFNPNSSPLVNVAFGNGNNRTYAEQITYVLPQNGDWLQIPLAAMHVRGRHCPKNKVCHPIIPPTFKDDGKGKNTK